MSQTEEFIRLTTAEIGQRNLAPAEAYHMLFDKTASPFYAEASPTEQYNCALHGLASEAAEYLATPTLDELGDVIWYHARACKSVGFELGAIYMGATLTDIQDNEDPYVTARRLAIAVGKLNSMFKKTIEKKKWLNQEDTERQLSVVAGAIFDCCDSLQTSQFDVMLANIKKLEERHGEGFNAGRINEKR